MFVLRAAARARRRLLGATRRPSSIGARTAVPWNRLDAVPQGVSDKILWAAVRGVSLPAPPPGPNASAREHERTLLVWSLLAAHKNVTQLLEQEHDG